MEKTVKLALRGDGDAMEFLIECGDGTTFLDAMALIEAGRIRLRMGLIDNMNAGKAKSPRKAKPAPAAKEA